MKADRFLKENCPTEAEFRENCPKQAAFFDNSNNYLSYIILLRAIGKDKEILKFLDWALEELKIPHISKKKEKKL